MNSSMSHAPLRRIVLLLTGQVVLLLIIGGAVSYQVRWVQTKINEMADLKDPSPFTSNLMGMLNTINLNLVGSLQNHDALLQDALKAGQKEFEDSVQQFHQENPRMFPAEAQLKVTAAYEPYKSAVNDTLRIGGEQGQKWASLLLNDDDMMFWLEHRLRPIVRNNQPDAAERLNVILNMESQLRSIPKDLTEYVLTRTASSPQQMDQNTDKFTALLHQYETISHVVAERKNLTTLNRLWADNVRLAQSIVDQERTKREAFARMMQGQQHVQSTIKEVLPAVRPEIIEEKKRAILHSITLILILAGILVLGGIGTLVVSAIWSYRRLRAGSTPVQVQAPTQAAGTKSTITKNTEFRQAMIGIGLDGRIVRWEPGAQHLYGYTADEIEGKSMGMLFGSEEEIQRVSHELKEHKQAAFDTTHRNKTGAPIPVHVVFKCITDPQGKMASLSLVAYERAA
jgi:PAS domain S-box-containing protein